MSLYELLKTESTQIGAKMEGVFIGIVTNNKDPEGLGRVKVKFPAREGEGESYWARIATLMAGQARGTFFLPEVNDEVLVAFEQSNINHPYILGCLWNGEDKPPDKNEDGKNNIRTIRSRSGHQITFNDDADGKKEKLEIQTKGGHRIVLDDASGSEKIEIKDKTGKNS
ncbi:MAG TPA: phage baseplate assembly protein V, partial [Allocoleopsis sp.]